MGSLRGLGWVFLLGVGACAPRPGDGPAVDPATRSPRSSRERSSAAAADRSVEPPAAAEGELPVPPVPLPIPEYIPAFRDREVVSVADLVGAIRQGAESIRGAPAVQSEYQRLLSTHRLTRDAVSYDDYAIVRVVFEATRDGGLWGIVWDITNREGHSDAIWRQWQTAEVPPRGDWGVTAVAECDELSALFAFLVRRLGIEHAGFLGGGPMHIVAHWTLRSRSREVRVVVPTSQIFLTREATLGTLEINAYSTKTVWDYWRHDVPENATIPAPLARYFVEQLPLAALPQSELQRLRNRRGGS